MSDLLYLQKARELLASPDSWIKEDFARDRDGDSVFPTDPGACQWCLVGAIWCATGSAYITDAVVDDILSPIFSRLGRTIFGFNDDPDTTHEDVLQVLDKAIAREKQAS